MIYKFFLVILLFFWLQNFCFWFNWQQWFKTFEEKNNWISASCEKQCFITLWKLNSNDKIKISWDFSWKWNFWYWFLIWNQFVPGKILQINWLSKIDNEFDFSNSQYYSQIPKNSEVILVFDWKVSSDLLKYEVVRNSFFEWIKAWWNDFWKIEWMKPYTINLRYWTKIFWVSIVKIFYWIFFIAILILFFLWKLKKERAFYIALSLFLIISFKNLYEYWNIYFWWLKNFTFAEEWNKNFYNMYDYYEFTDKSRKIMWIDKSRDENICKYYSECFQDWPYCSYWRSIFLRPCKNTKKIEESDYILLFKKNIPENLKDKKILFQQNQNFLLEN